MNRNEYCEAVLAQLRRLTPEEKSSVRTEIDAHIEDHICTLLDLGYDEALAEERTMARMGDPEEVGRELDKQYPMGWLVLGRIALVLSLLLALQAMLGFGLLTHLYWSVEARVSPAVIASGSYTELAAEQTDIKAVVGNDILKVYQVSVGTREGKSVAQLSMCAYDRIPGGIVSDRIIDDLVLTDQRGDAPRPSLGGGGRSNWGADYANRYVPVQPGDTYVTVTYDRFGEFVELNIPLPEVTP